MRFRVYKTSNHDLFVHLGNTEKTLAMEDSEENLNSPLQESKLFRGQFKRPATLKAAPTSTPLKDG